jgi:hypothetical protein
LHSEQEEERKGTPCGRQKTKLCMDNGVNLRNMWCLPLETNALNDNNQEELLLFSENRNAFFWVNNFYYSNSARELWKIWKIERLKYSNTLEE